RFVLTSLPGMNFPLESATIVDWRREELVDDKGRRLDVTPRPAINEVGFVKNEEERRLSKFTKALCTTVKNENCLISLLLDRTLQSSPAAHEKVLRRFVVESEKIIEINAPLVDDDLANGTVPLDLHLAEKERAIAEDALQTLEGIQTDSKLEAFVR